MVLHHRPIWFQLALFWCTNNLNLFTVNALQPSTESSRLRLLIVIVLRCLT